MPSNVEERLERIIEKLGMLSTLPGLLNSLHEQSNSTREEVVRIRAEFEFVKKEFAKIPKIETDLSNLVNRIVSLEDADRGRSAEMKVYKDQELLSLRTEREDRIKRIKDLFYGAAGMGFLGALTYLGNLFLQWLRSK